MCPIYLYIGACDTHVRFKECRPYITLDVQLLSELKSIAAVPAEMESEQEDLHEERIVLVAEVNINTCSEDVVCLEIVLSTQRKQPENTSNS